MLASRCDVSGRGWSGAVRGGQGVSQFRRETARYPGPCAGSGIPVLASLIGRNPACRVPYISLVIESVAESLAGRQQRAISVQPEAVGAERQSAQPSVAQKVAHSQKLVEAAGIEPASEDSSSRIYYVRSQSFESRPLPLRLTGSVGGQFRAFRRDPPEQRDPTSLL